EVRPFAFGHEVVIALRSILESAQKLPGRFANLTDIDRQAAGESDALLDEALARSVCNQTVHHVPLVELDVRVERFPRNYLDAVRHAASRGAQPCSNTVCAYESTSSLWRPAPQLRRGYASGGTNDRSPPQSWRFLASRRRASCPTAALASTPAAQRPV